MSNYTKQKFLWKGTVGQISAASGPKFTILWGLLGEILLLNKFFFRLSIFALVAKI